MKEGRKKMKKTKINWMVTKEELINYTVFLICIFTLLSIVFAVLFGNNLVCLSIAIVSWVIVLGLFKYLGWLDNQSTFEDKES